MKSIVDDSGTVRVEQNILKLSEKSNDRPLVTLNFSPGDKFPLDLINLPYSNLQLEITRGDVELFTPVTLGSKGDHNFIKVSHLSGKKKDKISESFSLMDNPGIDRKVAEVPNFIQSNWSIEDESPAILQFNTCNSKLSGVSGWMHSNSAGWVWNSSGACYIRAGSRGARVDISQRFVNDKILAISSSENIKKRLIVGDIVGLLSVAAERNCQVEDYIALHSELRTFRAGEAIDVDVIERLKAGPETSLKILINGSVRTTNCNENKTLDHSDINRRTEIENKTQSIVVQSDPGSLVSSLSSNSSLISLCQNLEPAQDRSFCLLGAEELLYSNCNKTNLSWRAETDCEVLFMDRYKLQKIAPALFLTFLIF